MSAVPAATVSLRELTTVQWTQEEVIKQVRVLTCVAEAKTLSGKAWGNSNVLVRAIAVSFYALAVICTIGGLYVYDSAEVVTNRDAILKLEAEAKGVKFFSKEGMTLARRRLSYNVNFYKEKTVSHFKEASNERLVAYALGVVAATAGIYFGRQYVPAVLAKHELPLVGRFFSAPAAAEAVAAAGKAAAATA